MAQGKKKIIVYADWIDSFEELSDRELGKLFRHFFEYVNDRNPVLEDRIIKVAWKPIEATLKRDLEKWQEKSPERVDKARKAGIESGKKRRELKGTKRTKTNSVVQKGTKRTVSVSDSVSVSVNDSIGGEKKTTPRDFYKKELALSENNKHYLEFIQFLFGNNDKMVELSNVLKLEQQCTYNQFTTIHNKCIDYKLDWKSYLINMDNYKDITKKVSLQSTLLNWMNKDIKQEA